MSREFGLEDTIKALNAFYLGMKGKDVKQPPIRTMMKAIRYALFYLNKDLKMIRHGKIQNERKEARSRAKAVDYDVGDMVVVYSEYGKRDKGVVSSMRDVGDGSYDVYYAPLSIVTGEPCRSKRKRVNNFKCKVEKYGISARQSE